ncbi:MAG: hypothetical protein AAF467_23770 [Actinomycetota bacterium]
MSTTTTPTRSRASGRMMAAALLGAIALLGAACGGSTADDASSEVASINGGNDGAAASSDDAGADEGEQFDNPEDAMLAFEECMEEQGIGGFGDDAAPGANDDVQVSGSDGDSDQTSAFVVGGDLDPEEFDAALNECNELLGDAAGDFEMTPEQEAELRDAELAFNECMAEQGFDMGSPSSDGLTVDSGDDSGGGQAFEIDGDVDFEELDAAAETCNSVFDELSEQFEASEEGQ